MGDEPQPLTRTPSGSLGERLDTAPCGYLSVADDGRVLVANMTLLERLGYERDDLIGNHVEAIFTIPGRIFYQTHVFPLIRMHGSAQELFMLLRTKTDEVVGMLCNFARVERDGTSNIDCVLMEVRERRKYEDALLQAKREAEQANYVLEGQALELEVQQQQLQEQATELERQRTVAEEARDAAAAANRAKSEFLAVMSHELRTPLNAIGGYAQLLESGIYGAISTPQTEALRRIIQNQRHLLGLINDILNLARVETGRVDYVVTDVSVADVIDELAAMIEPQMRAKNLVYDVSQPEPNLRVCADREKLVQILLNLLSNAVKFTQEGGRIAVQCRSAPAQTGAVQIEVADTGRGMPADKLEAVFEPFVQVRATAGSVSEGAGLGLSISRNLARGMGGDLTVESTLGEGSAFTLTLPAA